MTNQKLIWIFLGMTALLVVIIVVVAVAIVGLKALGVGDTTVSVTTPTVDMDDATRMPSGTSQITGTVWHDLCASGLEGQVVTGGAPTGCVTTATGGYLANGLWDSGEPGIPGVTVRLGSGACPAVGLTETVTAADGGYIFPLLPAGEYCLSVDPSLGPNASSLLPGSWSSPLGSAQAMRSVTLGEGASVSAVDFGWDYQYLPVPPSATPTPTATATITPTPTRTSTPAPVIPCDWIGFVKDVTVPDGTTFGPDEDFRKTWRLKNIGTCTWTKDYDLVFVSGNRMTGDNVTPLKSSVKPGETIDVSIELTAPLQTGKHTGFWTLRNASGVLFGMGPQAKDSFWVTVSVEKKKQLKITYDLAGDYCSATWVSGAGEIDCPTEAYDVSGYVERLDAPVMEGGRVENEWGLWVIPEGVSGGYLSGIFPPFKVESGDRFRTVVSCLDTYNNCNVEFRLEYRIGDGEVKTLGKWTEAYEGKYTPVDVDLTPLAGKEVRFILTIKAGDTFDQDSGLWLRPSVWR